MSACVFCLVVVGVFVGDLPQAYTRRPQIHAQRSVWFGCLVGFGGRLIVLSVPGLRPLRRIRVSRA